MKKTLFIGLICAQIFTLKVAAAADTLHVMQQQIPLMVERTDNVVMQMRINAHRGEIFDGVTLKLSAQTPIKEIKSIKLYYGGTDGTGRTDRFAAVNYIERSGPRNVRSANPNYSSLQSKVTKVSSNDLAMVSAQPMVAGVNYFWVSVELKPNVKLSSKFGIEIVGATVDKKSIPVKLSNPVPEMRVGVGVRYAGDDGVDSYRIPGLVTTNSGTLLSVYDVRYNNSVDLQEKVDVGVSRSTDGGASWEKMRIAMDMGTYGGLPAAQNGVGDPSILVDQVSGDILIIAAWSHGMGNQRMWTHSQSAMSIDSTAQLLIVRSSDDGRTWSKPVNITTQIKDPSWRLLFQGPGRGVTMKDGTLVFPAQFIDATNMPHATIIYSTDRGATWAIHSPARSNTTEAQVVEVTPGVLMLNMRDNRGGSRAVATTTDMGRTWVEHSSSRSELQEPVCMASLIAVDGKDNATKNNILLFSNPNSTSHRNMITIKGSVDGGVSFPAQYHLLLDQGESWGYSCLTMIDPHTVGILYEASTAHMVFQAVPLKDIFGDMVR